MSKAWPNRPKSMSERGYRKYMAKTKTIDIYGLKVTLQSVSAQSYLQAIDRYGVGTNRKDTEGYQDWLLKNIVVMPRELANDGVAYFSDDLASLLKLVTEIDRFLVDPPQRQSTGSGAPESAK